jgi:amino acid transporter
MNVAASDPQPGRARLGLWDAISIILGIVIGASVFKVPWLIFANVSDAWAGLLVWVLGGALALVGALCYAELATTYPRSGGDYVYLTNAFGSWVGFLFGWAQLVVVFPASIAAMAYVFAESAIPFFHDYVPELNARITEYVPLDLGYAVLAIVVISLVNILGVTLGKTTQNLLTVAKVLGLAGILVAGFLWAQPAAWGPAPDPWSFRWEGVAMILVLYAYGGWNDAAFVAAEVKEPRRNMPRALVLGVAAVTLIYVLVNTAYVLGLGFDAARSPGPNLVPTRLLEQAFGKQGSQAMSLIVMVSALGAVNGLIFTGARVYATLGADHRLFGWMGHWRPGRGAPVMALLVQALICLGVIAALVTPQGQQAIHDVLSWFVENPARDWKAEDAFETLVSHTAPVFWMFFLLTGLALFKLREKNPDVERPFSVPLYPVVPLIFCNMCLYMLYQSIAYEKVQWRALFALGLTALGLPLYWLSSRLAPPGGSRVSPRTAARHLELRGERTPEARG